MLLFIIFSKSLIIFVLNLIFILIFNKSFVRNQRVCEDVGPPRGGSTKLNCVGSQVKPGFECDFECFSGCTLIGSKIIRCENNGWNPPAPALPNYNICKPPDCQPRSIQNGNTCGITPVGERCTFSCNSGYIISGQTTFECLFRLDESNIRNKICLSEWESSPLPVCTQIRCSPDLMQPINGNLEGRCQSANINDECRVVCNQGFTPNIATIRCISGGWSPSVTPVCNRIPCPSLVPSANLIFRESTHCTNGSPGSRCEFNCVSGYSLSPNINFLECNSIGQWSNAGQLPTCVRVCFPDITNPTNGFVSGNCQTPAVGQECRVDCSSGYQLVPNTRTIQCTSNGWNPSVIPVCQRVSCPQLVPTDNLILISNECTNGYPGSRCQFNCPFGYQLSPNINYLECDSNGQWSAQLPHCNPIQCPNVPVPTYSKTSDTCVSANVNSECTITCFENCFLNDNTEFMRLTCIGQTSYGGWDREIPIGCRRPQMCDPIDVQFASSCPSTSVGKTCAVNCLNGYRLSGNNVLTCVESPQPSDVNRDLCLKPLWSPSPLSQSICIGITCPDISTPIGGQYVQGICKNANMDDVCTLICGPGYQNPMNNGSQMTARCQSNGQWDGPIQCVQITCPPLQRPINGTFTDNTCNPGIPGSYCYFSCYGNFELDPLNLESILCQQNGTWSNGGVVPSCVKKLTQCINIPVPINARTEGQCVSNAETRLTVGSNCTIVCFDGCYLNEGTDRLNATLLTCIDTIESTTSWNKPIPLRCEEETECRTFGPLEFGSSCQPTNVGENCTLTCNEGYTLVGNKVFTCIRPSNPNQNICTIPQWSFPPETALPVCQPLQCPDLVVLNGNRRGVCEKAVVGQECIIVCPDGKETTVVCQPNSQWSGQPECVPITCPALNPPKNGNFKDEKMCAPGKPGQLCQFECGDGYILQPPEKQLLCQASGSWSPDDTPPQCVPILCEDISGQQITNGGITNEEECKSRGVGAVCKFFCKENFVRNGEEQTTCGSDGMWSHSGLPTCNEQVIQCDALNSIENGKQEGDCNPGSGGKTCTYICNNGFILSGDSEFLCQNNGWDKSELPICQQIGCPQITQIENGNLDGNCAPGVPSQKCTFTCNNGFELAGPSEITCDANGEWDAEQPICNAADKVTCPGLNPAANINMEGTCNPGEPDQKCTLSCNTSPSRMLTIICQNDGTWSDSINGFNCGQAGICPPAPLPNGAKYVNGTTYCSPGKLGMRCQMGCGKGYSIDGKNNMLCSKNGKWLGTGPKCLRQCRQIRSLNGRLFGQCSPTGLQNRYCSLRCNPGFQMVGPRSALCAGTGLWQPTVPQCLRTLSNCG